MSTKHNNYFLAAFWAGMAAPVAIYDPAPPFPYVMGAGTIERSFMEVAKILNNTWQAQIGQSESANTGATTAGI